MMDAALADHHRDFPHASPWTTRDNLVGGTHVCLRYVRARDILSAIAKEKVTHLCGAPGKCPRHRVASADHAAVFVWRSTFESLDALAARSNTSLLFDCRCDGVGRSCPCRPYTRSSRVPPLCPNVNLVYSVTDREPSSRFVARTNFVIFPLNDNSGNEPNARCY